MIAESEDRTISATATFNNGSTWAGDFSFKAFKEPEYASYDRNDWLSCSGKEWYSLPSGNIVCHVKEISKYESRRETCRKVGGFLAEITNRADAQTLLYIIYKLNKAGDKSTNMFAVGAMAQNGRWVWENSGLDVEVGIGKLLKPTDDTVDLKLTHIGSNYPCMTDPARGYKHTKNNSTMLTYKSSSKEAGKVVQLKSRSLKNYGMK